MRMSSKGLATIMAGVLVIGGTSAYSAIIDVMAPSATSDLGTNTVFSQTVVIGATGSFDIKFDVSSSAGTHTIYSGNSSATTDTFSWGLSLIGADANDRDIFLGAQDFGVSAIIDNLRIDNFITGDSGYVIGDIEGLSLNTVTIADSQSPGDRVTVVSEGMTNAFLRLNQNRTYATVDGNVAVIDLKGIAGITVVDDFKLLNSTDAGNNKWAVNSIQVSYAIPEPGTLSMFAAAAGCIFFIRRRL